MMSWGRKMKISAIGDLSQDGRFPDWWYSKRVPVPFLG